MDRRVSYVIGWGLQGIGLAAMMAGCAVMYPTLSTPVRGAVAVEQYEPPPPKDILFVSIKSARIPIKTRDGRNWDEGGGHAPDPFAVLFVDDKEMLRTSVVSNTLQPQWPSPEPPVNLKIPSDAKVRIEVWDDNALVSHPICNERVHRIDEAVDLGELEIPCESGATVVLSVTQPKARSGIGLFYIIRGKEVYVLRVVAASPAGRAGLLPEDQILSVDGRPVSTMVAGELQGIFQAKSRSGVDLEIKSSNGQRRVTLVDEPMYPVKGEGVELLPDGKSP